MLNLTLLSADCEERYETFLKKINNSLIYHSVKYRNMIMHVLNVDARYGIVEDGGKILGVLPVMIQHNKKYGAVINSLPFFGSIGGILCEPALSPQEADNVEKLLINNLYEIEKSYNCVSSCVIALAIDGKKSNIEKNLEYSLIDKRRSQVVFLPQIQENIEEVLFKQYFSDSLRRNIKKAKKNNFEIKTTATWPEFEAFYKLHYENMRSIRGIPKPINMFRYVYDNFKSDEEYNLFLCVKDKEIVSGLLALYYNNTVEYFVPAINEKLRNLQTNSLLIYHSMLNAVKNKFKYYNFGGTWHSQIELYRFKKKWGAKDINYHYYIRLNKNIDYFKHIGRVGLAEQYPYFYVLPFDTIQ